MLSAKSWKTWLPLVLAIVLALPLRTSAQITYTWDGGAAAGGTAHPTSWDTTTKNWTD
jgi:hypothetical protein